MMPTIRKGMASYWAGYYAFSIYLKNTFLYIAFVVEPCLFGVLVSKYAFSVEGFDIWAGHSSLGFPISYQTSRL